MLRKKNIIILAIFVLIVIGATKLIQTGLTSQVEVTKAVMDTAIDAVPAVINVRSDYTFTLSSEESGRVVDSKLVLGTSIKAGELVLELDSTDLEIEIDALKTKIETTEAQYSLNAAEESALQARKEDLENLERLYAAGTYPELEMQRQRRSFKVFQEGQQNQELGEKQNLANLQASLKRLERRLEKTKVYAPTDGIVTQIYAYPGELVSSSSTLAEVFAQTVVVEAKINEENFAGVQEGLESTVRLLTYGNRLFEGRVDRVLPTADQETQQYTVLLDLDIDESLLLPGLSGEASIIRRKIPNALIIPRRALVGNFVFKAEDGQAVFTPVKIGVRGLQNVEIVDGLSEGDLIITDGMTGLKDGDSIRVAE